MTEADGAARETIPIIDLAPLAGGDPAAAQAAARGFGAALEQIGFAVVVGHGVPEPVIEAAYGSARAFFALPLAEKQRYVIPDQAKTRGYLPVGIESVALTLDKDQPADLCEALIFRTLQRDAERPPEAWAPNLWPDRPAALGAHVRAYCDAVYGLARRLYRVTALALDLPAAHFEAGFADPQFTLRLVNYPDQPTPPLPNQLRYGAHQDYGGLTILRQDSAPGGLEICGSDGVWCDVPVIPHSFVINVGDLMSRWTNGRWRSTLHRVVNPPRHLTGSTQRLSMVLFTTPNEATEIACLPTCCDDAHPPQFEPVHAGAYVQAKIAKSMELGAAGD
jgi:isopenicillin N synthase-like dioxygenase